MKRLGSAICLLVVLAALALPAGAAATILLQRGIGGAAIGMTQAQVKAKLGKPLVVRNGRTSEGRWTAYAYRNVSVVFVQGKATNVSTTARSERTPRGAGVGTTEAGLKSRIKGIQCKTLLGTRSCRVGRALPGRAITTFALQKGRVVIVTIQKIPAR